MRIFGLVFILFLLAATPSQAQYEEFNFKDGRSLQARIASADEKEVVLERVDGLTFTLDVSVFVPEDQAMINDWRYQQLIATGQFVSITGTSIADNLKVIPEEGVIQKEWDLYFTLTITNNSTLPAEGLRLEYQFITTHDSLARLQGKETQAKTELTNGNMGGIQLAPGESKTITTTKKKLHSTQLEAGWTWPGGGTQSIEDFTSPLSCKLYFRDELIAQAQIAPCHLNEKQAKDEPAVAPDKKAATAE